MTDRILDISFADDGKNKHQSVQAALYAECRVFNTFGTIDVNAWGPTEAETRQSLGAAAAEMIAALLPVALASTQGSVNTPYAVGPSPEACVRAWCGARGQVAADFDVLEAGDKRYDWGLRFTADGDGMKAAGITLPSGACIMTWWK